MIIELALPLILALDQCRGIWALLGDKSILWMNYSKGRGQGQGAGTGKVVLDSRLRAIRSGVLARIISLMEKLCDPVIGSAPSPLTLKRGKKRKLHLLEAWHLCVSGGSVPLGPG